MAKAFIWEVSILKKFLFSFLVLGLGVFPVLASAHVTVKPDTAGVGAWTTFSMGVPVEKDMPTTALRLVIPEGLEYVTPNVKPGWKIDVKKDGDKVTEISWTGGSIPAGQRDEFVFSAKVPSSETSVQWKAYQTYKDGTVVSWDQDPASEESDDESTPTGPYSVTRVVNDLKATNVATPVDKQSNSLLPVVAIAMSGIALAMQLFGKKA